MTQQERIRLLLDMQEHSENYTDEQLDQLLQDEELAALLEELALTKRALMRRELSQSKNSTQPRSRFNVQGSRFKVAASFIGILLLSGIAFAAIHIWNLIPTLPTSHRCGGSSYIQTSDTFKHSTLLSNRRGVGGEATTIFDNVPLDSIVIELAIYYNKVADIRSERAHDVRLYYKWHSEDSLATVICDLNHFERVNLSVKDDTLIVKP